jgi:signal transduction histidine kinase
LAFVYRPVYITEKVNRLLLISGLIFLATMPITILLGLVNLTGNHSPITKVSRMAQSLAENDLPALADVCDRMAAGNLRQQFNLTSAPV